MSEPKLLTAEERAVIRKRCDAGNLYEALNDLRRALDDIEAREREMKEVGEQFEFDRSAVADGITAIRNEIDSRHWLTEGRGPYEWNDDRWHDEFRFAAEAILDKIEPLAKIAADWSGCPMATAEVAQARIDLKQLCAAKDAEIARLREALREVRPALEIAKNECGFRYEWQRRLKTLSAAALALIDRALTPPPERTPEQAE